MLQSSKQAKIFIESLHSKDSVFTFESLQSLIEILENKEDPESTELRLLENIYQFVEKLKILENNLSSYVRDTIQLPGNKLSELYDNTDGYGTSKFFKE